MQQRFDFLCGDFFVKVQQNVGAVEQLKQFFELRHRCAFELRSFADSRVIVQQFVIGHVADAERLFDEASVFMTTGAVDGGIVHQDNDPIPGVLRVGFDLLEFAFKCGTECGHRILGRIVHAAAVGSENHSRSPRFSKNGFVYTAVSSGSLHYFVKRRTSYFERRGDGPFSGTVGRTANSLAAYSA